MGRKLLILIIGILSLFFVSAHACVPSPGTNIYLTDDINIDFENLDNLGLEGENYILEGNAFIYRSTIYPNEIAVKTTRNLIIISPFSQNYSEAVEIVDSIDWYVLVNSELSFLVDKKILSGLSDKDIENIANCSASTSMIKKSISEATIILKECDNWYQISHCAYEIIDGEKQTICPTCGETIFSGSIPSEKINLESNSIEDSKDNVIEQKIAPKYINIYLYLLLFTIIIIVCAIIIFWRYKK